MSLYEALVKNCFPFPTFRPHQEEACRKILAALFEQDYGLAIIDAPVGFGKSPVLVGIATTAFVAEQKTSFYTTPQIVLQNQLTRDFPQIPSIKGRSNYNCLESVEQHQNPILHCDMGSCLIDPLKQTCPYSHGNCLYLKAKEECKNAPICCMNLAYYLTAKNVFDDRDILIIDEGHNVSEWGIRQIEVVISRSDIGDLPFPNIKTYPETIDWLKTVVQPAISSEKSRTKSKRDWSPVGSKDYQYYFTELSRLERILEKITLLLDDWEFTRGTEEWIISNRTIIRGKNVYKQLAFTPITAGRFLGKLLWSRADKIIVSSGTISPDFFIKEAGLGKLAFDPKDCVISVPSDFPPERSPIYYKPVGKMIQKEKETTWPHMIRAINEVILPRQDRRGIVHTYSYENANYIYDHIDPSLRYLLVMQDRNNRDESLANWLKMKGPSLFISTNMTEGLDLKDDLARYQIYVKLAYPFLGDPRVKKRLEMGGNGRIWYNMMCILDILQASGRCTRSREDWSELFIFDSSFDYLYKSFNRYFKPWFKDRMNNITNLPSPIFFAKP
jgi:Rad3-related DNA helicase